MPNAASTQNMTKMSRIAVLLSTNSRPSSAISKPATQPSSVERVIRRVTPGDHQDRQRPDDRRGEPPAERGQAEQPLADRDHRLAERRVRHVLARRAEDVRAAADEQRVDVLRMIELARRAAGSTTHPARNRSRRRQPRGERQAGKNAGTRRKRVTSSGPAQAHHDAGGIGGTSRSRRLPGRLDVRRAGLVDPPCVIRSSHRKPS